MPKNPNNATVYIRDNNLKTWQNKIGSSSKSDFVNWCIENKLEDYKKHLQKTSGAKNK